MNANKEVIFLGLSGPTHHYGGLSPDNFASGQNRGSESSPRQAALQVVALARYLLSLGITTAILPPQLRPCLPALQEAGFTMENAPIEILEKASSSSFMWAANAATVTPIMDSSDHKLYITTANLHTNPHRRIEAQATYNVLRQIFANVPNSITHPPLDAQEGFLDEGAANHMRLSPTHGDIGLNVFVYGKRQNMAASKEIAKNHQIPPKHTLFLEQNTDVISKGVFHNDVIAVSNENLLLVHERAYKNGMADIAKIEAAYKVIHPQNKLQIIVIKDSDLSVEEAVGSYFFNSQIVTKARGKMAVIAPVELKNLYNGKAAKLMERIADGTMDEVNYIDLKQSMKNGGGPACLRLRVVMDNEQISAIATNTGVFSNENMLKNLEGLIKKYYPETLATQGLRSHELYQNGQKFLAELAKSMNIVL